MQILPDFLSEIIKEHDEIIAEYYSDELYKTLLRKNRSHLFVKLAQKLDLSPIEQACAAYHHQSGAGRPPTHTIPRLLRAVLIGQLNDLSLRELETELNTNMLARWFTGYGLFEAIPDHSTLGRFEGWLIVHQPQIYFETILTQVRQEFPEEKADTQMGDTYAMKADAATHGVVEMLRRLSIRLLESWRETDADFSLLRGFDWVALFGVFPEKHPGRMSKKEKAERLQKTVLATQDLHRRLSPKANTQTQLWLDYIRKVIHDYISRSMLKKSLYERNAVHTLSAAPQTPKRPSEITGNEMENQTSHSATTSRSLPQKTASLPPQKLIPEQRPTKMALQIWLLSRKSHPINLSTMPLPGTEKPATMSCKHQVARQSSPHP